MTKVFFAAALLTLGLGVSLHDVGVAPQAPPQTMVRGTVEFRVIQKLAQQPWYQETAGARILVIGPDGKLLKTGVTNEAGKWMADVEVPADPRFAASRTLGTVTAIAVANGYVERIFFDVPVATEGAVQVVSLSPIRPRQRNEPGYELGMLHRLWVLPLLDNYAQQAGLTKQAPVEGDWNSPHWGPDLKR